MLSAALADCQKVKQNCWEFKKCGRQRGGPRAGDLGVCPASIEKKAEGLSGGCNGGRICWALAGTLCGGKVQGSFAEKLANCLECEFYRMVCSQEGANLKSANALLLLH